MKEKERVETHILYARWICPICNIKTDPFPLDGTAKVVCLTCKAVPQENKKMEG